MKRIKKNLKRYIAFLAVLIILVSISATPAHAAITPSMNRMKAFIASAITALNITMSSGMAPMTELIDYIADPFDVVYTYTEAFNDRPTIQIWDDYVTIDGVDYTDIWLSNEAAEKFRVDGFDFISAYNIASNTQGTFASGEGYAGTTPNTVPVFTVNNVVRSQGFSIPNALGDYYFDGYKLTVAVGSMGGSYRRLYLYNRETGTSYTLNSSFNNMTSGSFPIQGYIYCQPSYSTACALKKATDSSYSNWGTRNSNWTPSSFDFDYVADNIPLDQPLPSDTGMMIRVPTNTDIRDFVTDNPEFNQPGGTVIDVNIDPDIMTKLDDLIDIIAPIIPVINNNFGEVTFIENHTEPTPVVDTLLPDTWWSSVVQKFDQVINAITNFNLQPVIQAIQSIPSAIQTLGQNITQAISNLGDTILQDIEQGPIKVIDKALDKLKSIFLPILANLRNALGIWHYVVEWINGISAPFTWIFGIVQGGMSFIMVPIYASIAGWIVIMVYKRFGR